MLRVDLSNDEFEYIIDLLEKLKPEEYTLETRSLIVKFLEILGDKEQCQNQ